MRTERGACELKSKEVGKVRKLGAAIADLSGNVLAGAVIDCSYKGRRRILRCLTFSSRISNKWPPNRHLAISN
jgi:hypothetical protein